MDQALLFQAGGAAAGAAVGGPSGAQLGAGLGGIAARLIGGRTRAHVTPERWASGLQAAICLRAGRGGPGCGDAELRPFLSSYWQRRFPTSAQKWRRFASTGRPQWSSQSLQQAFAYEARRAQLPVQQGLQLGAQALRTLRSRF